MELNTLDIDWIRIFSSIFWVLGALFGLWAAVASYHKDLTSST